MWIYLKSGGNHPLSRYDMLAEEPHTIIGENQPHSGDEEGVTKDEGRGTKNRPSSFGTFAAIAQWLATHHLDYIGPLPFVGGLIGTIDYGWPHPHIWLMAPQRITVWDHHECRLWRIRTRYGKECQVEMEESSYSPPPTGEGQGEGEPQVNFPLTPTLSQRERGLLWTPTISKSDYITQVQRILHHIHEGDIYQANLAQTFTAPFDGDAYAFWHHLLRQNPAPFFAYIRRPDMQILGTSPELLLRQRGTHVESRPIKGTRPRGRTPEEDAAMRAELIASEKEGAELAMIVDLVRNDLHRSCVMGSVAVPQHRVIESYTNVFHQISVVTGELASPQTNIAALEALFPGGSITGCPKIRAMEIIAETEQGPRGIYTGSLGYASLHGTQDWNIAIRTATVQNKVMSLSVGGGIVADSDPEKEYEETLHKAATFGKFLPCQS